MENILIIGDYNREDFLFIGKLLHEKSNIYFLEYSQEKELTSSNYKKWGKAIFWKNFKDAFDLLDKIKPSKVLFYFIESFNHVALNVACKYWGIKTYHIEHGIRYYEIQEMLVTISQGSNNKQSLKSLFDKYSNIYSRVKTRLFFNNTVAKLPSPYAEFLKAYYKVRSSHDIFNTFRIIDNLLRVADSYISFSPKIFEFHQKSDHLPDGYPVYFTGCPGFDHLKEITATESDTNDILFIDQAFEAQSLFGWNVKNKTKFLKDLIGFANKQNRILWLKAHPYSSKQAYNEILGCPNVRIIQNEVDFKMAIANSKIVIGFYSTLLMPLMALDHTICFSLDMYPAKPQNQLAGFLLKTGAIKGVDNWEELEKDFENLEAIFQEQRNCKQAFIDQWMYKFDGRCSERMKNILLSETD